MRRFLTAAITVIALALPAFSTELGDDGLHKEPWFRDTFKDMREDLAEANAEGKRLLIIWEQRGCLYCAKMHEEVYSDPEVRAQIEGGYFVVQMNLFGDVSVTDFDGETLPEKEMAMKWGVMFTPTMMFFPEEVGEGIPANRAVVAAMPGAFGKGTTGALLTWVQEHGYESGVNFQKYVAERVTGQ
ncbi:thioredoxin family protein [Sedimentimonas flavescens]|uniref:thioredoxin family protein n=1 Tax=Sedimentimonas flavescens TaxID=2851012 RepID=UPI0021A42767|nr:thioredoxin family protein [Sedimentimonas flavescens]MCT2538668.1 thioredoxin family protein [Sedimentimonas flavescens]